MHHICARPSKTTPWPNDEKLDPGYTFDSLDDPPSKLYPRCFFTSICICRPLGDHRTRDVSTLGSQSLTPNLQVPNHPLVVVIRSQTTRHSIQRIKLYRSSLLQLRRMTRNVNSRSWSTRGCSCSLRFQIRFPTKSKRD
jgi:hypothetical protein